MRIEVLIAKTSVGLEGCGFALFLMLKLWAVSYNHMGVTV